MERGVSSTGDQQRVVDPVGVADPVDGVESPGTRWDRAGSTIALRWPISARVTASLIALALVVGVFTITTGGTLLQVDNIVSILDGASQLGIIAVGVTLLMIGGEYDLSVGETFVLTGMVVGLLFPHVGEVPALILGLLVAAAVGAFNGVATVYLGLPSFISTLGTYFALSGIILILTNGAPVTPTGTHELYNVLNGGIGSNGAKLELLWWLGLVVVATVVLGRTRFGNHVFATGGDRVSAANNGVMTARVRIVLFVICAVLAGFAGVVQLGDIGTMAADAGSGLQLNAIAAAVIGGTSLFGGTGGVVDSVIGAVFLSLVSTALILSGASPQYYLLFVGLVVIVTVSLHLRASRLWNTVLGILSVRRGTGNSSGSLL